MANEYWSATSPVDHTLIGDVPVKIRDTRTNTKEIIGKEHVAPSGTNAGGQHLMGSSRVYLQSGLATLDPEGNTLATGDTTDSGRLCVNTALSNLLQVYVATSAGVSTGFENVRVDTAYINIAAYLLRNGSNTFSATGAGFKNDTTMASDAVDAIVSQHAIVSYVATSISARVGAGTASPLAYAGGESMTLASGMILKFGYKAFTVNSATVTFGVAFPTGVVSVQLTPYHATAHYTTPTVVTGSVSVTSFVAAQDDTSNEGFYWLAMGY